MKNMHSMDKLDFFLLEGGAEISKQNYLHFNSILSEDDNII